ncbi:MAG TPA: hypothetical protein VGH54_09840 [Mycobacterium sp.]|jgi:hypothetical protein|uniref:hypothetical protein n=1 Tax=Mycobacterium sp. TaxID=1785 RepID=UPI002F408386
MRYAVELGDDEARAIVYDLRNDGSDLEKAVADQIAKQLPTPPPAEPSGDCVVFVRDQWPPFVRGDDGGWDNRDGYSFGGWEQFTNYFKRGGEFVIYRPEGTDA